MNRAFVALVALAGVLALAFSGCAFETNGIPGFSFDCPSFSDMKVQANPDGFTRYLYSGWCSLDGGPRDSFFIEADYSPTHTGSPGTAFERITDTTLNSQPLASFWLECSGVDPWFTDTACAVVHHAGPWSDGIIALNPKFPISSSVLTAAERQQLKDAKNVWKTQFCPAQDMWSVIPTPAGNATYANNIPIQVAPGPEWCQLPLTVDIEWQRNTTPGSPNATWTPVPANLSPLAQLNVFQHPAGVTLNKQLFDQLGTGPWRVRARYSGQAAAPWSAWSYFKVN